MILGYILSPNVCHNTSYDFYNDIYLVIWENIYHIIFKAFTIKSYMHVYLTYLSVWNSNLVNERDRINII